MCQNRHILFFIETLDHFLRNSQPFLKKQSTVFLKYSTVLIRTVVPFCGQNKL